MLGLTCIIFVTEVLNEDGQWVYEVKRIVFITCSGIEKKAVIQVNWKNKMGGPD